MISENLLLNKVQSICSVIHHFGPGVYIRELTLQKGSFVIGHYQKKEHTNLMWTGKVAMIIDGKIEEFTAPLIFAGKPGRKMGYVVETCTWFNIFSTDETDIEKLENELFDKSDDWKRNNEEIEKLCKIVTEADREDYRLFLSEIMQDDESYSKAFIEFEEIEGYKIIVRDSAIHGKGIFSSFQIPKDQFVCPVTQNEKLTQFGRFINHSVEPSCRLKKINGDLFLVTNCDIPGCVGSTKGTELTINYRL